jgi:phenylacetic acid degradation operon negative regulatory protein
MKDGRVANVVRERGYEALFLLASCVAGSLRPTLRTSIEVEDTIGEMLLRRKDLQGLRDRGLIESRGRGGHKILRLTELGARSFAGGRDPEQAWGRKWDGQWRLIVFDLPRNAGGVRTKFWRWLRSRHFGQLQGSVWLACDAELKLGRAVEEIGLEPSTVLVFTGQLDGKVRPLELVTEAWDFSAINRAYADYMDFAGRVLKGMGRSGRTPAALKSTLADDRRKWWQAVRRDPLLPRVLLPKGYKGVAAWKMRRKMHARLFRSTDLTQL